MMIMSGKIAPQRVCSCEPRNCMQYTNINKVLSVFLFH